MNDMCALIQELLPLYKDNSCNEECYKIITKHLETCDNCNSYLENLDININIKKENLKEFADIKKLSKKLKIEMLKNKIKGIIITVVIFGIIFLILSVIGGFSNV